MSLFVFLIFGASAFDDTFERSVQSYRNGDYAAASAALEQLVEQGVVDPAVHYNLGNAFYRQGKLGLAIANYERTLQLDPRSESAQQNLSLCIDQTKGGMQSKPRPPEWERALLFWHESLRPGTSEKAAVFFWILFWVFLGIRQIRPLPYLRVAAGVAAIAVLAFGASWWAKAHPVRLAVAVGERVPVRYGTDESETVRFELFEGDRVRVDSLADGWIRVSTWDGERGWARADDFVSVEHPIAVEGPPDTVSFDGEN